MTETDLVCWKCGASVADEPLPFARAAEVARVSHFRDIAARRHHMRPRRKLRAQRMKLVLVAPRPVEREQERRATRALRSCRDIAHDSGSSTRSSRSRRCACWLGSCSASPRCAVSSSVANPGSLVATSNSTPPGVRK